MNNESIGEKIERIEGVTVDCIACNACAGKCPLGLDIPRLLALYNEYNLDGENSTVPEVVQTIPADNRPDKCIGCGACQFVCPQKIEIWKTMGKFANMLK